MINTLIMNQGMNRNRPSWDEYFKELVILTSKRSSCEKLQVGCLLVKDNRIISQGYNGFLPGCKHESVMRNGHEVATIHAEQNALLDCAKRGVSCDNSNAYITHYPCYTCIKMMGAAGIKKVYYIDDYKNDELTLHFAKQINIDIKKI